MSARLTTYTLPRPFNGYNIPIAIQSAFMRDYATRSGYKFSLPVTELTTSNSFVMLRRILAMKTDEPVHLTVCSGFVFPIDDLSLMSAVLRHANSPGLTFHLVLEAKVFTVHQLLHWAQEINHLRSLVPTYDSPEIIQLSRST